MGTYKDTLNLPKTDMPIRADLPLNEPAIYKAWDDEGIFLRMKRDGKNPFVLHDGPPYANGNIHIGHALNKILKDFAVKFQYFNGRAVEFTPGWDCHGLPIEQKVQAIWRLGGRMKKSEGGMTPMSMAEAGVDFTAWCRDYASEQVSLQMAQFKTLGVLADWENHYETMSPQYEEMIARRLQELADKGFLVRRKKPVYWSWAFGTALAEAEVEYRDKVDESAYVIFDAGKAAGFLVWTTTPWTLPANVAVAVNPMLKYCFATRSDSNYLLLVADDAFDRLKAAGIVNDKMWTPSHPNLPRIFTYEDMKDIRLTHPIYPDQTVPVIAADFVTADKGTGCVHIAPGHGEDDYQVALKYDLPIVMPVGPNGSYSEGKYSGLWIFEEDSNHQSNKVILDDLKKANLLVHTEQVTHSYPYCSRSGTPVIFRATDQWFLDLDKVRALPGNPVACLQDVEFVPGNTKNRLMPMLSGRPDWCISRQRKWGVKILDSEDILDVWFDSGLSWNILNDQADLYLEGNDQHRGWFQSSLWLSSALLGRAPYKKIVTHGFVVDQNGEKMSKSKGNVVAPEAVLHQYGAEVLRYWVASTDYTRELQCSNEIIQRAAEGHKKLRNTFRFLVANMPTEQPSFQGELLTLDAWIRTRSRTVFGEVHGLFSEMQYYAGMQKLTEFVNGDLNSVYMNAVKDRLYCSDGESRNNALAVMSEILRSMLMLIAPFFTYMAQEVFGYLPSWMKGAAKDIFDLVYWEIPAGADVSLGHWPEVLDLFHVEFNKLRTEGKVRDTLEVFVEGSLFFDGAEDLFVVSGVREKTEKECLAEFNVNETTFRIVKSDQNKCERCWKRNASDVLCNRCQSVLETRKQS